MTISAVFHWENQDSTKDLNSKFQALFTRGVLTGGLIQPVSGDLSVDLQPFTCMSNDGMLVTSDNSTRLTIPLDQTNIIVLHALHQIGDVPILDVSAIEASAFSLYPDKDDYIIFGTVTTVSPATEVALIDISYTLQNGQDKRTRSPFRGYVADTVELPTDPNFIWAGDFYVVTPGGGSPANLYGWDGLNWNNMTATAVITSDLAQHRANMFSNEIHLTDDQADAALGSSGLPDVTNRYVTESDGRLPTQNENNALIGSDGTPSATNKFVTQEYPLAVPTVLSYGVPPGGSILITALQGPVYVGKDVVGSANKYFSALNFTQDRGYLNSFDIAVRINGVYKDVFLTTVLDPSTDVQVDANGFFSGGDLYLGVDNVMDSPARVVFGRKDLLKTIDRGFPVFITPSLEVISGTLLSVIANIKGRLFDDPTPTSEQNINLRIDIDGLSSYVGSVLETNIVAANEDFVKLATDPILGPYFEKNIGVADILTFDNTGLVIFTYSSTNGRIQFGSPVTLSGVRIGDLFRDGAGDHYLITAVNDGLDYLDIVDIQTGLIPLTITASVGNHLDGSTKVNNNPRNLLLSEMKFSYGEEFTPISKLVRKPDEFSFPDGQIAYSVVRHDNRFDPRVVFYGGWENYQTTTREKWVRNATGNGQFTVTGFFTELVLILRRKNNSPSLSVSIDGQTPTTVSTSALGTINANVASSAGPKYEQLVLASGLPSNRPNTITASIVAATAGSLDIYGIIEIRSASATTALLESGRAFENARIVSRDTITPAAPLVNLAVGGRGGRLVYAIAENSHNLAIGTLQDLDAGGSPAGTATGSSVLITVGSGKLNNYNVNDIIVIYSSGIGAVAEIRRISSIVGTTINLSSATSFSGTAVAIQHVCSTDSNVAFPSEESPLAHYVLPVDFIDYTASDFQVVTPSNRFVVGTDGLTIVYGKSIGVVDSGIIGATKAIEVQSGGSAELRFTVLATRLDLLVVNSGAATVNVSIDGSPFYLYSFAGTLAQRRTIFSNARYQAHEVIIQPVTGNFAISEMFLSAPKKPEFVGFPNEVADLIQPARYVPSLSTLTVAPNVYPTGTVFKEALHYLSYLNGSGAGTDWVVSEDFTKALQYGRYVYSSREDATAEFYVLGTSFELQYITGPDHGIFVVEIDGVALELTGSTIVGDYTGNQVDGYSAVYGRKNIGAYGFTYGHHKIVARIQTPRATNGSSSDYNMAFTGYYQGNNSGYMAFGINKEGVYSSIIDLRTFIPLDTTPLDTSVQETGALERSGQVPVVVSTTAVSVTLTEPYPDTSYLITPTLMNLVDAVPSFQPILITAQSASSFTVTWNSPMPSGNYILNYFTRSI